MHEANRILRSVKSAFAVDGIKLPPSCETDGLMMLLGRIDCEKFLAPKIKHARAAAQNSSARRRAAAYLAFFRALSVYTVGMPDPVTTVSFNMLNRTLFGDLEENAGRPRQTEYVENGSAHTAPSYIPGSIRSIVTKMNEIENSPIIGKEDFAGYLTHYMRELIILHPFDCGSDITVRIFIMLFCRLKGFALCYYRASPSAIKDAETSAFVVDDATQLFRILADCLSYEQTTEKKRTVPRTRREMAKAHAADEIVPPIEEIESADEKRERTERQRRERGLRIDRAEKTDKSDKPDPRDHALRVRAPNDVKTAEKRTDPDKLKRAIKLQQKITRLNEQLTELMLNDDE